MTTREGGGAGSPEEIAACRACKYRKSSLQCHIKGTMSDLSSAAYCPFATALRDARARALDEAAEVADEYDANGQLQLMAKTRIASAIRSLKAQP